MSLPAASGRTALQGGAGLIAGLALVLAALLSACAGPLSQGSGEDLQVTTSTAIIADIVRNVAGDLAVVRPVVPDTADPHTYASTPREIARLEESDLLITVGANLEKFTQGAAWRRTLREAGVPHLELAAEIELLKRDIVIDHGDHVHDLREGDPHIWLDPLIVIDIVELVRRELDELAPEHREAFASNAARYTAELLQLHNEIERELAAVPIERRKLIVSHDSYGYFARRYGFEVIGYVTRADNAEPSARDVANLLDLIEREQVRAVFKEPTSGARVLEQVAREAGVPVGTLIGDAFTREVTRYVDLMRYNLRSILQHLG
jgi:ABC-type Zn uptake system ZnuABC Zn-binding protein ZnuA